MATSAKQIESMQAQKKKVVSTASIFKQLISKKFPVTTTLDSATTKTTAVVEHASPVKSDGAKSSRNPRSLHEAVAKVTKKKPAVHSLAVEYNTASNNYRLHVYHSTSKKIGETLKDLVGVINPRNLQTVSSDDESHGAEPRRLTIDAKLHREATTFYMPISMYRIQLKRTNTNGDIEPLISTLGDRMANYEQYLETKMEEANKLMQLWETIVGEIWKLGVHVLGKDAMESLLLRNAGLIDLATSCGGPETASLVTHRDSKGRVQKHVTFGAPVQQKDKNTKEHSHDFLNKPSQKKGAPVAVVATLSKGVVGELRNEVDILGAEHMENLRKAEKDNATFWKKKKAQIALVLVED